MLEHRPHAESRSGPVARSIPGLEPVGVEGCMTCAALSGSREVDREAGVTEAVASANREIENHPHSSVGQGRKLPMATVWGWRTLRATLRASSLQSGEQCRRGRPGPNSVVNSRSQAQHFSSTVFFIPCLFDMASGEWSATGGGYAKRPGLHGLRSQTMETGPPLPRRPCRVFPRSRRDRSFSVLHLPKTG